MSINNKILEYNLFVFYIMDEIRKKTIDFLKSNQGCYSVKTIIKEIFNINEQADFRLTFDVKEGTIIMISNNPNANVIVGDAIGEITLMLSYIKELSDNGCAMIYQINKNDKIIIGNSKIKDESNNHYCITNDLILKYIDKEIMVISDKLQDYIDRDCKSFNDYTKNNVHITIQFFGRITFTQRCK